jgi:hypothetical protein
MRDWKALSRIPGDLLTFTRKRRLLSESIQNISALIHRQEQVWTKQVTINKRRSVCIAVSLLFSSSRQSC